MMTTFMRFEVLPNECIGLSLDRSGVGEHGVAVGAGRQAKVLTVHVSVMPSSLGCVSAAGS
jgi:hypothetical protein